MALTPAPTVRETLEKAVDAVLPSQPVEATLPEAPADAPAVAADQVVPEKTAEAPAPKGDDRPRNPDGTFAKTDEKAQPEVKAEATPAAPPARPKVPRPSSWKKELESHWDTLAPEIQSYVTEREKQYATGVSTYKGEADRAKGVMEAVNQFAPMLQSMGIEPQHWIKNLGVAHHFLANGTPQERVQTVADIIRNNRVDVQALVQVLSGQQPTFQQQQQGATPLPQQRQQPIDINAAVQEALDKRQVEDLYKAFTADVEAGKYPHFADDEVKGTMAGLLQAGLAQDYPSAYEVALSMPKHKHLAAPAPAAAPVVPDPAAQKQAQAARARSQAVSVKSSTPSTMSAPTGKKGLRDELSAAFDSVTSGGRV